MHMLYDSDSFAVVQIDVPSLDQAQGLAPEDALMRGGFEIVDKFARKEIFIEGALAQQFQEGVEALSEGDPSEEDYDDFIAPYASMSQTPVQMH